MFTIGMNSYAHSFFAITPWPLASSPGDRRAGPGVLYLGTRLEHERTSSRARALLLARVCYLPRCSECWLDASKLSH
jgi:hypothetical protein